MTQLFGTDGIRGRAGVSPLDAANVRRIGAALISELRERVGRTPRVLTGRDTRESGQLIENEFTAGVLAEGGECESAGVITTPGVAFIAGTFGFDAGVVISASHNPFEDNGIKVFSPTGRKLEEEIERAIEANVAAAREVTGSEAGVRDSRSFEFRAAYLDHLRGKVTGLRLDGRRIVVDAANGAASGFISDLFAGLGAGVITINDRPDGRNINANCGSLHLGGLRQVVVREKADLGIALDGDADRALFVDERGEVVDGDATLWIIARYLLDHGQLQNRTVVATVMSNIGLELAMRSMGIKLLRTAVGDKYVLEKLLETGSELGGEQSGHMIFPRVSLVGDGLMTALFVLRALVDRGVNLSEAADGLSRFPQILLNVKVGRKQPFDELPEVSRIAADIEDELQGEGRLLLRYSGTENLARVMIEGRDRERIEKQARRLAGVLERALS